MDKNTITGLLLIAAVLIGFSIWNRPTPEQIEARKRYQDSISQVQKQKELELAEKENAREKTMLYGEVGDSAQMAKASLVYGEFAAGAFGDESTVTLENDLVKLDFSTRGARVASVVVKQYLDKDKNQLTLFRPQDGDFGFVLNTVSNRKLTTSDMNFKVAAKTDTSVVFSLPGANGGALLFSYVLPKNSYMLQFNVEAKDKGMMLAPDMKELRASWSLRIPQQEVGREFEDRYAQMYYYDESGDRDYLSEHSNDELNVEKKLRWVAFKDQYFSSIFIVDNALMERAYLKSSQLADSIYLKKYEMESSVPFEEGKASFRFFFGPNSYKLLKSYNEGTSGKDKLNLNRILTLGFSLIRWVNQFFIIPLFDFFGSIFSNYGLVILLLTLSVKLILTPLTYKSYLSSAKMRVLKPQLDALNEKYASESPMERQQRTQEFYKDAGVNPAGGCLPMLLSFPFLTAVYFFIPVAIELRHVPFLWAKDLSSYDAIISWNADLPLIGDHISLFCLLMTIVNIVYTKYNMQMNNNSAQMDQMKFMKYMMYGMPIYFFFWFNKIASGLCYYYFLSLFITILQTFLIRKSINEEKLLADIEEHRKKRSELKQQQDKADRMRKSVGGDVIGAINDISASDNNGGGGLFGSFRKKMADFQAQMAEAQKQMAEEQKKRNGQGNGSSDSQDKKD